MLDGEVRGGIDSCVHDRHTVMIRTQMLLRTGVQRMSKATPVALSSFRAAQAQASTSNAVRLPTVALQRAWLSTAPGPGDEGPGSGEGEGAPGTGEKQSGAMQAMDYDDYDDYQEPTTAGGKVAAWTRLLMQIGFLGAIAACFGVAAVELFPGPTGPSNMYSAGFDVVRINAEVQKMVGDDMTAYGRSVGRRHIDSHKYVHEDGSNRTRIRFNVMGRKGRAMVWAEMSDRMGDVEGEFAYLIVQDQRTGRIFTVHDNRSQLDQLPKTEGVGAIGAFIANLIPK